MKQIGLVVLLTVVAACPVSAQTARKAVPAGQSAERQLIELERQLSDALAREDAKVLDRLWSNDLVFTFPNGKVSNKAQRLAGQKPAAQPRQSESKTTNDEVRVHLYGNTAVVTVLSTWSGKTNDEAYSSQFQATHVWVKQGGRWQLVAAHVSPVKK
jgi:ketosteroid isomerase-like protein